MNFFKRQFLLAAFLLPTAALSAAVTPMCGCSGQYTLGASNDNLLSRYRTSFTLQHHTGDIAFSNIDLTGPSVIPTHIRENDSKTTSHLVKVHITNNVYNHTFGAW